MAVSWAGSWQVLLRALWDVSAPLRTSPGFHGWCHCLFSLCVSSQMPHELVAEQEQDSLESSLLSCSLMVSQQVREDWDGSFHMMQKSLALPGAQGWGAPVVCMYMCVCTGV